MAGVQNLLVMTFQIEENFPGGGGLRKSDLIFFKIVDSIFFVFFEVLDVWTFSVEIFSVFHPSKNLSNDQFHLVSGLLSSELERLFCPDAIIKFLLNSIIKSRSSNLIKMLFNCQCLSFISLSRIESFHSTTKSA